MTHDDSTDGKRYGVILADPPWNYRNKGVEGAAEAQYQTMSTAEIAQLPIQDLAAPDSVLILWATWPTLYPDAGNIIDAWGFEYVTGFPWVKVDKPPVVDLWGETQMFPFYGIGFWVRGCSEPVLIARRGKPRLPDYDFLGLVGEGMKHSRKPDNLYHYAESLSGPYLELFARRTRPGWDVWGNEVESTVSVLHNGD